MPAMLERALMSLRGLLCLEDRKLGIVMNNLLPGVRNYSRFLPGALGKAVINWSEYLQRILKKDRSPSEKRASFMLRITEAVDVYLCLLLNDDEVREPGAARFSRI